MDELCDYILMEIFLRIPVKCVFSFRSVSKRWTNVLSDPLFCSKYQFRLKEAASNSKQAAALPLLGFFHGMRLGRRTNSDYGMPLLTFLPTCTEGRMPFTSTSAYFINTVGYILGISNGLILCLHRTLRFYVCNPVTNQWFSLPQPNKKILFLNAVVGFSYEEFHDLHKCSTRCAFTVVRAAAFHTPKHTASIETYSSETGLWKESVLTAAAPFCLISWLCTAIRGIFYFITSYFVAVYDPNTSEDRLWLMQFPTPIMATISEDPILAETPDGLLQCGIKVWQGFQINYLRKKMHCYTYSETIPAHEWVPLYFVLDTMPLNRNGWEHWRDWPPAERYPSFIAFHPQNSNIVYFRFNGQIVQCDCERDILQVVQHVGLDFRWTKFCLFPYLQPEWPPSPFPSFKDEKNDHNK